MTVLNPNCKPSPNPNQVRAEQRLRPDDCDATQRDAPRDAQTAARLEAAAAAGGEGVPEQWLQVAQEAAMARVQQTLSAWARREAFVSRSGCATLSTHTRLIDADAY